MYSKFQIKILGERNISCNVFKNEDVEEIYLKVRSQAI